MGLAQSGFRRVKDIPGEATPGALIWRGGQDMHLRGVTRLALSYVDYFADVFPEAEHGPATSSP